jgi:hypothetical protein
MLGRLRHQAWCLRIFNGLRFGRHRGAVDAEGTRARIERRDDVEGGDVFESFRLLHRLFLEYGGLLSELLHLLRSKRFAWARRSDRITIDGAVGRVGWGAPSPSPSPLPSHYLRPRVQTTRSRRRRSSIAACSWTTNTHTTSRRCYRAHCTVTLRRMITHL